MQHDSWGAGLGAHAQSCFWGQALRIISLSRVPTGLVSVMRSIVPSRPSLPLLLAEHEAEYSGGRERPWSMPRPLMLARHRPASL